MTLTKFSETMNIPHDDMLEILSFMKYFREDYTDWEPIAYDLGIAKDSDNVAKPDKLRKELSDYHRILSDYYYSRSSKNGDNTLKSSLKEKISKNNSVQKFVRSDF